MREFLCGGGIICLYFILAASIMMILRKLLKIPNELFRKILHYILQFSYILFVFAFQTWWKSVIFGFVIVLIAYPIFLLFERTETFSSFVNERKTGEFRLSLVLAFVMLGICNTVCWGWLEDKCFGLACMYAWGIGDGVAALFGKKYGKHKTKLKFADPQKTWEGSLAMFIASAISIAVVLILHGHANIWAYITVPIAGAAAAAFTELITPNGMDTVTCPMAAMAVMIPLMFILGGFA